MTFTVELKKDYALRILEDLQLLDAITLRQEPTARPAKERTFKALSVSTKGFRFNREEANER